MIKGEFRFNEKHARNNPGYREALEREKVFSLWLDSIIGHKHIVAYATQRQNIEQDIDVVVDEFRTLSFKYVKKCKRTGNLGFELETYSHVRRAWVPGWYKSGRSDYLVMEAAGSYYLLDKYDINQYVLQYGWDEITSLGAERRAVQEEIEHDHRDAKNGLIKLDKLVKLRIAKKLPDNYEALQKLLHIKRWEGKYYDEDAGLAG